MSTGKLEYNRAMSHMQLMEYLRGRNGMGGSGYASLTDGFGGGIGGSFLSQRQVRFTATGIPVETEF